MTTTFIAQGTEGTSTNQQSLTESFGPYSSRSAQLSHSLASVRCHPDFVFGRRPKSRDRRFNGSRIRHVDDGDGIVLWHGYDGLGDGDVSTDGRCRCRRCVVDLEPSDDAVPVDFRWRLPLNCNRR